MQCPVCKIEMIEVEYFRVEGTGPFYDCPRCERRFNPDMVEIRNPWVDVPSKA